MHKINRKFMPQIDEKDLVPLLSHLAKVGINCTFAVHPSAHLVNHQEVDPLKVEGITHNKIALDKPLLIAAHGMVLDGNHRAAAHKKLGTENVAVIIVPLPYEDALLALAESPVTYAYGDGDEHPITI